MSNEKKDPLKAPISEHHRNINELKLVGIGLKPQKNSKIRDKNSGSGITAVHVPTRADTKQGQEANKMAQEQTHSHGHAKQAAEAQDNAPPVAEMRRSPASPSNVMQELLQDPQARQLLGAMMTSANAQAKMAESFAKRAKADKESLKFYRAMNKEIGKAGRGKNGLFSKEKKTLDTLQDKAIEAGTIALGVAAGVGIAYGVAKATDIIP